ncbi:hypothetical protein [Streptomyces sp. NPDC017941]|uniref:hypothetical protein n=1 Tax=Streptomyces sp. NPDC017941 TaxID=3365018 RepID=UPI0037B67873
MSCYLEEAAQLLRKSAEANEKENRAYSSCLQRGRERLAREFALLASIDRGLVPAELTADLVAQVIARQSK